MYTAHAEQACVEAGNGAHPQDYLNFFAPCKREPVGPNEPQPQRPPKPNSPQVGLPRLMLLLQNLAGV